MNSQILLLMFALTLIVDDDAPADFSTIQSAVNAAQLGDTVLIQPGTYQEPVIIDGKTDLTIQGVNRDSVLVQNPYDLVVMFDVLNSQNASLLELTVDNYALPGVRATDSREIEIRRLRLLNAHVHLHGVDQASVVDNGYVRDKIMVRYMAVTNSRYVAFGRNSLSRATVAVSRRGEAFYFASLSFTDLQTFRIWGNQLDGTGFGNVFEIWLEGRTPGLNLLLPNNVWGVA
jgi:hypothetical protein